LAGGALPQSGTVAACPLKAREAAPILVGSTKVVKEQATATLGDDEPHAGVGQQQGGQGLY